MKFVKSFFSYICRKFWVCNDLDFKNHHTKNHLALYVGQKVWHKKRLDCGAGKVIKINGSTVSVSFNGAEFSDVSIENFTTERPCHEKNNKPNKLKAKNIDVLINNNAGNVNYHDYFTSQKTLSRRPRLTHCHGCKTNLSSNENRNCSLCNWLVCPKCGSCAFHCVNAVNRKKLIFSRLRSESVESHQLYDEIYCSDEELLKESTTECEYLENGYNEIDYGYAEDIDWEDR